MADDGNGVRPTGRPRLQGVLSSGQGIDFELNKDLVLIGRSQECDLVLDYPGVSRRHAQIRRGDRAWVVDDLGSANGLLLNGRKIQSGVLGEGDVLTLGPGELRFVAETAAFADDDKTVFRRIDPPAPSRNRAGEPASGKGLHRLASIPPRRLVLIIAAAVLVVLMLLALCGRDDPAPTSRQPAQSERPELPERVETPTSDAVPEPGVPPAGDVLSVSPEPRAVERTDAGPIADEALQEARNLAVAHAEAAQLSFDAGRLPDAVRDWRVALELDPRNDVYRVKLESALELLHAQAEEAYRGGARHYQFLRYDEAIREWNRVLHLIPDPDHPLHQNAQRNLEQARIQKQR